MAAALLWFPITSAPLMRSRRLTSLLETTRKLFVIEDNCTKPFVVHREVSLMEVARKCYDIVLCEPYILVQISKDEAQESAGKTGSNELSKVFSFCFGQWKRGFHTDASEWYVKATPHIAVDKAEQPII